MIRLKRLVLAGSVAISSCLKASFARPDDNQAMFKGNTIRLVVGLGAGDSFDLYARLLARHMPAYLPGKPTIIVQNMAGAGSLTAFNYLMNAAPRDGTVIGMVTPASTIQPLLNPSTAKFDPMKVNWLGSLASDYPTCGFWTKEKVTLSDLQTHEFIVGSTGTTAASYAGNQVFMNTLGLKFKIVPGYGSMNDLNHAAEKGEVQGHCGVMATNIKSSLGQMYNSGQLQIVVRANLDPDPSLASVPNAFDLVHSEDKRQDLLLLAGPWSFGRPFFVPPDVPPERLSVLRSAFAAVVHDVALLNEARDLNSNIDPMDGRTITERLSQIYAIQPDVIARARPMFGVLP